MEEDAKAVAILFRAKRDLCEPPWPPRLSAARLLENRRGAIGGKVQKPERPLVAHLRAWGLELLVPQGPPWLGHLSFLASLRTWRLSFACSSRRKGLRPSLPRSFLYPLESR